MVQIPTSFYIVLGVLVVGNISVILTIISFIFKAGMFVSNTNRGIGEAKERAEHAHKRIDIIVAARGG